MTKSHYCSTTLSLDRFQSAVACLLIVIFALIAPCRALAGDFSVSSPSIEPGAAIGLDFTCMGRDSSPAISWTGAPAATRSFALIVEDPDAPSGTFIHWVAYNVPAGTTALNAGIAQNSAVPGGGIQGVNGFGNIGYNGPCPPPGKVHHYHFRVFALDSTLDIAAGAGAALLESAMKGHVVASAELIGTFSR